MPCGDGSVCAPGTVCVLALDLCVAPAQIVACESVASGERCATTEILVGVCHQGACVSSGCGNGLVETGEVCDDGNTLSGDGCSADCRSHETCGNGIVDVGEQCDCGTFGSVAVGCTSENSDASGLCSSSCRNRCGDGIVAADEACDPGNAQPVSCIGSFDRGLTTCTASCTPVLSSGGCRYMGFRTRRSQAFTDTALVAPGQGFYVAGDTVGRLINYVPLDPATAPATLAAVWADLDHGVAVGAAGTIMVTSGTLPDGGLAWSTQPSNTLIDLRDVWGRNDHDVYAVGEDLVLHWNGVSWSPLDLPITGSFRAVAGDSTTIYVAGDGGALWSHDDVDGWRSIPQTTADLTSVWASDDGRVVAVGAAGAIVQRDAGVWRAGRTIASGSPEAVPIDLAAVWGSSQTGWFAAGARGTVLFDDGSTWRVLSLGRGVTGSSSQPLHAITGAYREVSIDGSEDVITFEGAAWSPTLSPTFSPILALTGTGPDDVFAVGTGGTILHHDGISWVSTVPRPTSVDLHAVAAIARDDVYAVGDHMTVLHFDGAVWSVLHTDPAVAAGDLLAIHATNRGVTVAGTTGIFALDASSQPVEVSAFPARALCGAGDELWAGGAGIRHFDGTVWEPTPIATAKVFSLACTVSFGDTLVQAIGPTSYRYDAAWNIFPAGEPDLEAAAFLATNELFAAGRNGALIRTTYPTIEPFAPATGALDAVYATGKVVFMAGPSGAIETMIFDH